MSTEQNPPCTITCCSTFAGRAFLIYVRIKETLSDHFRPNMSLNSDHNYRPKMSLNSDHNYRPKMSLNSDHNQTKRPYKRPYIKTKYKRPLYKTPYKRPRYHIKEPFIVHSLRVGGHVVVDGMYSYCTVAVHPICGSVLPMLNDCANKTIICWLVTNTNRLTAKRTNYNIITL